MKKNKNKTSVLEELSFGDLLKDVKKHRKLFYKVLPITFVISVILTFSIPNYYTCTVMLAPELSSMGVRSSSGLAGLASSFGVSLGGYSAGADALLPMLYPDLMNSVTFRASLFPIKVQRQDDSTQVMTYYDYLKDGQKYTWWSAALKATIKGIVSLFKTDEQPSDEVNTFKLTKEQATIVKLMEGKVVCDVDERTMVITINVTDQDPLICATIADSVQMKLQNFITDYRTSKARVDLKYNKKLYAEAKKKYDEARRKYAAYSDANQKVFLERVRSEQTELQTELSLCQTAYTQVANQLRLSEAKVQQDTPAFTTLQPATVPTIPTGPKRARTCLFFLFLAFIVTSIYAINKEGHLKPLFTSNNIEDDDDDE